MSAAMMTRSASAISCGVRVFWAPTDPWVSTLTEWPSAFAPRSTPSAAMKVWAMPVGQEVTATTFLPPAAVAKAPPRVADGVRKGGVERGAHRLLALEARVVPAFADEQDRFGAGDRVRRKSARDGLARSQFDKQRMTEPDRRLLQGFGGERRLGWTVGCGDHRYQV